MAAPTVTPPPFPGPRGSGPHPVLGEPSGPYCALRPNDGSGNASGAHRAIGENSGTRSTGRVPVVHPPATARDVNGEMVLEGFVRGEDFNEALHAVVTKVAGTLVGAPTDQMLKQTRGLVDIVLSAGTKLPEGPLRILAQLADSAAACGEGKGTVSAAEDFRDAASLILKQYRKSN